MFTKAAHTKPSTSKAHHPAFNRVQQSDSFIPAIQPKLEVDSASSAYEAEADRMADHVVSAGTNIQPTNFVSSNAPVQTSSEPLASQAPELDAAELADQLLPPMPGEDSKVTNPDAEPEQNVVEEKKEKKEPETVEKDVKEKGGKKDQKGGGAPAPKQAKVEVPAPQQAKGEDVSPDESAAFTGEPNLEPLAPIELTPELTKSIVQTKMDDSVQREENEDVQEEASEEQVQAKLFDTQGSVYQDNSIQRSGEGTPEVSSKTEQGIAASKSGGQSLDGHTQQFMESQFQADFSNVKVHTDNSSATMNNQLRSKAFTHENHVYFNEGQYDPGSRDGQHLLAHELTHVVQQDSSIQRKPQISNTSTTKVQRLGVSDALDYFADKANYIPGYRMFTIILGLNPINMSKVDRSAANIMRAMVEFLPGGGLITDALDNHGVFDKASAWFKEQMDTLNITGGTIRNAVNDFLDSLGWSDIFDLGGVWNRAKRIFTTPIKRIINFAKGLVSTIIDMVKEAILRPLAGLAEGTPAYDLLRVVIGSDPITGDPYPPTAENLIGGFMKLIGQEEIWKNIQEGNAIDKAYTWFKTALGGLMGFVTEIPKTFIDTLKSLTWTDIVLLPKAFVKVGKVFLNVAGKFLEWAGGTVLSLLEIVFTVVAPGAIPWIKKAGAAFEKIISDPVGFLGNLIKAAKNGFLKFADNIGKHLKAALINWLTGSLAGAGIYIPTGLSLQEIIKFVLSVLGISWANIRVKLVKHLGEPAVKALETGFELVSLLVTKGPMAMWEKIMEHLSDLQAMVMGEITSWVMTKVVTKAMTKLVSSLNPAGAVIQAILFVYDTVTFLLDKIKQIASVGFAVLDSIVNIANGVLGAAIDKVEKTLAGMLTLAVNFLAHFLGLGKVSKKIIEIVNKIRDKVDAAIDKVIDFIITGAKNFLKGVMNMAGGKDNRSKEQKEEDLTKAIAEVKTLDADDKLDEKGFRKGLAAIKKKYKLKSITLTSKGGEKYEVLAEINPSKGADVDLIFPDADIRKKITDAMVDHGFDDNIEGGFSKVALFAAKGRQAKQKVGGELKSATLGSVLGASKVAEMRGVLVSALDTTIMRETGNVAETQETQGDGFSVKGVSQAASAEIGALATRLIKYLKNVELFFIAGTKIPRLLKAASKTDLITRYKSISKALYSKIAKAHKSDFNAKFGEQVHHIVPLYLGGSHNINNLIKVQGQAKADIAESVHAQLHHFIDELSITLYLENEGSDPEEVTLDGLDFDGVRAKLTDDKLVVLLGMLYQDGTIKYKETDIKLK
ncbi:MAG: DUF4157 domain-containing protein [Bacteroidota bacterium]